MKKTAAERALFMISLSTASRGKEKQFHAEQRRRGEEKAQLIHRDAVSRPLEGGYPCETDRAVLGAVVCGFAGKSHQSVDRGHVDDSSVAFALHDREDPLRGQEWPDQHHTQ